MSEQLPLEVQEFLRRFTIALSDLPKEEQEEIILEIQQHLEERGQQGKKDILDGFGNPEEYAGQFIAERALTQALAKGTSFSLGHSLLIGHLSTITNYLLVIPLILMQLFGVLLMIASALKPFLPHHVGLFLGAENELRAQGVVFPLSHYTGTREVLGWWTIPIFAGSGLLLFWLGNYLMKGLAKMRLQLMKQKRVANVY